VGEAVSNTRVKPVLQLLKGLTSDERPWWSNCCINMASVVILQHLYHEVMIKHIYEIPEKSQQKHDCDFKKLSWI